MAPSWLAASLGAGAGAALVILWQRFLSQQHRLGEGSLPPRGSNTPMAPVNTKGVLSAGKVAVIVGSAGGIGRAVALRCVKRGMKVVLADIDVQDAASVRMECVAAGASEENVVVIACDCSNEADVLAMKAKVYELFGRVHFLMNNAAIQTNNKCGPYEYPDRWRKILDTNLWGVYLGGMAFVPQMIAQDEPCVVVNTGSKQGITMPPGDTAYNVSKAGVKVLTEALQHQLRSTPSCKVNAFLLVPGCVNTMIRTRGDKWVQGEAFDPTKAQDERSYDGVQSRDYSAKKWKARGAWSADELVDELFGVVDAGTPFYIICQDHETTRAQDDGRIQWSADDIIFRRAPLSRWSEQYAAEYKEVAAKFI